MTEGGTATDGKPHKLAMTFDVDGFSNWIGSLGVTTPGPMSRGEYERVGLPRILALLAEYQITSTFFVPGSTAVAFPRTVEAIPAAGHEVGHHGWVHEPLARLTPDRERYVLERGLDALDRILGVRPIGYRSPSWDSSLSTVDLLLEHSFQYDSSLMGNDYEPYWCRVGDVASQEEGFSWGRPVDLVQMPVSWHLDDHPYFVRVDSAGVFNPGLRPPSSVLEIWKGELDYLCRDRPEGVIVMTLHPQVMGRGHLLAMLRSFIEYALSIPTLAFTTCGSYQAAWRAGRTPELPEPR